MAVDEGELSGTWAGTQNISIWDQCFPCFLSRNEEILKSFKPKIINLTFNLSYKEYNKWNEILKNYLPRAWALNPDLELA